MHTQDISRMSAFQVCEHLDRLRARQCRETALIAYSLIGMMLLSTLAMLARALS